MLFLCMKVGGVEFINAFYKYILNEVSQFKSFQYCFRRKINRVFILAQGAMTTIP